MMWLVMWLYEITVIVGDSEGIFFQSLGSFFILVVLFLIVKVSELEFIFFCLFFIYYFFYFF